MSFFIFLIVLFIIPCQSYEDHRDLQCFLPGECTNGILLAAQTTANEYECLDFCKSLANCTWFTFYPESNACFLYENCESIDEALCSECLSGQKECSAPEPTCWVQGYCHGHVLHNEERIG